MLESTDIKDAMEDIVSSYEERIENISSTFDTVNLIFDDLQESFFTSKAGREQVTTELRDILAANEHLRKNDFDVMMQGIVKSVEEQKEEVKDLLKSYFIENRAIADALKENLGNFKASLAKGEIDRVKEFKPLLKNILTEQEKRKEYVTSRLKEFQKEQSELSATVRELLAKGEYLRIRDFKSMLKDFKQQSEQRLELQKIRKAEVTEKLDGYRQERQKYRSSAKSNQWNSQDERQW